MSDTPSNRPQDAVPVGAPVAAPEEDWDGEERDDAIIGKALVGSLAVFLLIGTLVGGVVLYLRKPPAPPEERKTQLVVPTLRELPTQPIPKMAFTEITQAAGIGFRHVTGARGDKLLPETMGGGVAFFDFDGDGDQDLLLVNSSEWPWTREPIKPPPTHALYRNDGTGKFEDVTTGSGLDVTMYGMGVAVGDYDNDGWVDVFISAVGQDRLFKNEQGKFRDVTDEAGVGGSDQEWGTSCCFFDLDNDGDLDLFVGNYVRWSRDIDLSFHPTIDGTNRAYGPPFSFEGTFPYLYRNEGGGKFRDISADAGVQIKNPNTGVPSAKTMGVAPIDLDDDGRLDLVVANDTVQNFLFHNQGQGRFQEIGALAGLAFDSQGAARGAMGIDAARFRQPGQVGVAIGNFANEMTALYVAHEDPLQFVDAAVATGLGPATRLSLTFGVFFFDYDLDGRLDLMSANGHLEEEINKIQPTQHYAQPPKLFWNCGPTGTTEFLPATSADCGADFGKPLVGRGSAYADIDGDGDLDVIVAASGGTPRLLRNDQQLGHHWLRVKLVGKRANRDAIGASVTALVGDQLLRRDVNPTRSYLSQSELPVTFGLGKASQVDKLIIRWPDGSRQEILTPEIDRLHVIEQSP